MREGSGDGVWKGLGDVHEDAKVVGKGCARGTCVCEGARMHTRGEESREAR